MLAEPAGQWVARGEWHGHDVALDHASLAVTRLGGSGGPLRAKPRPETLPSPGVVAVIGNHVEIEMREMGFECVEAQGLHPAGLIQRIAGRIWRVHAIRPYSH